MEPPIGFDADFHHGLLQTVTEFVRSGGFLLNLPALHSIFFDLIKHLAEG